MDHELKQRIIGAVVITALAAIFIPMLFDDPVDTRGKDIAALTIPPKPAENPSGDNTELPADKTAVLESKESDLAVSEGEEVGQENGGGDNSLVADSETGAVKQPMIDESEPDSLEPNASKQADGTNTKAFDPKQASNTDAVGQPEMEDQPSLPEPAEATPEEQEKPAPVVQPGHLVKEKPKSAITKPKVSEDHNKASDKVTKKDKKLKRYSIQAGSFSKKENAQALVEKLRKQGLPASMSNSGDLYRVKIGPELDKAKATEMKAKLDKQKIKGLLVSE